MSLFARMNRSLASINYDKNKYNTLDDLIDEIEKEKIGTSKLIYTPTYLIRKDLLINAFRKGTATYTKFNNLEPKYKNIIKLLVFMASMDLDNIDTRKISDFKKKYYKEINDKFGECINNIVNKADKEKLIKIMKNPNEDCDTYGTVESDDTSDTDGEKLSKFEIESASDTTGGGASKTRRKKRKSKQKKSKQKKSKQRKNKRTKRRN
jgi:hypothetical protein